MCGWIKIPTNIENTVWWKNPNAVKVFLYLCLKSNHEDFNYNGEMVRRGECFASLSEIATNNLLSIRQTRSIISVIQATRHLTSKATNKSTKFTICHLVSYKDEQQTERQTKRQITDTQNVNETTNKTSNNRHANGQHIKEIEKDIYIINPLISPLNKGEESENFSLNAEEKNNASLNTEDNEKKEKSSAKKERKVFVKPIIQEIIEYCRERQNNISAEMFFDFYESKGWKVGNSPMKDWRAAIRTWERGQTKNKNDTNNANNTADFRKHIDPATDYGQSDIIT